MSAKTTVDSQRFQEIDLLRFFAAFSVVSFHYLFRGPKIGVMPSYDFPVLGEMARYGFLGVQLFFMISGFVIAFSIRGRSPGQFLWSRALRLYPAFWFAIVITTFTVQFFHEYDYQLKWWQVFANFTMLNHLFRIPAVDGAYWSLYVELHFYLLVWLFIRFGKHNHELVWLTLWLFTAAAWQWLPIWKLELFLALRYAPFFVAGALLCRIRTEGSSLILWSLYCLAWLLSLNVMVGFSPAVLVDEGDSRLIIATIITSFYVVMAGIGVGIVKWIKGPVVVILGGLTYPLYLLHEVVGWVLLSRMPAEWGDLTRVLIVICLMLAGARLINIFLEQPLSRWLKARFVPVPPLSVHHV